MVCVWAGAGEVSRRVGADRPERDITKVEQPSEADHHVEPQREQGVRADLGGDVALPIGCEELRPLDGDKQDRDIHRERDLRSRKAPGRASRRRAGAAPLVAKSHHGHDEATDEVQVRRPLPPDRRMSANAQVRPLEVWVEPRVRCDREHEGTSEASKHDKDAAERPGPQWLLLTKSVTLEHAERTEPPQHDAEQQVAVGVGEMKLVDEAGLRHLVRRFRSGQRRDEDCRKDGRAEREHTENASVARRGEPSAPSRSGADRETAPACSQPDELAAPGLLHHDDQEPQHESEEEEVDDAWWLQGGGDARGRLRRTSVRPGHHGEQEGSREAAPEESPRRTEGEADHDEDDPDDRARGRAQHRSQHAP